MAGQQSKLNVNFCSNLSYFYYRQEMVGSVPGLILYVLRTFNVSCTINGFRKM